MAIRNFKARESTDYILIHATGHNDDVGAYEIRRQHLARGYLDIGYHYVIRRSGLIEPGRQHEAHSGFEPKQSVAICMCGSEELTDAQALSLRSLLIELMAMYPDAAILPKCQFTNFNFTGEQDNDSNRRNHSTASSQSAGDEDLSSPS